MRCRLAFGFCVALTLAAHAQSTTALVVKQCGTPDKPLAPGSVAILTVDTTGQLCGPGTHPTYPLLFNASSTGASQAGIRSASYLFNVVGTFGVACTVTLQALGADGTTYQTVTSMTTPGTVAVTLGNNATVQATVSGACTGLYASLS